MCLRLLLCSFCALCIHNYVLEHQAYLLTLSFPDFVALLHAEFLPLGWEDNAATILHQQQGSLPFGMWVAQL
jgi:hypothetical protein